MKEVSVDILEDAISGSNLVYVYFTASWCSACQNMAPIVESIDNMYKVDISNTEFEPLVQRLQIMSIPAILFFKDGKILKDLVGSGYSEEQIRQEIDALA